MLDKILVPLDGSPLAEIALTQIRKLLVRRDAEVVLVRAVFVPLSISRTDYAVTYHETLHEARVYVDEMARRLGEQGARARGIVAEGPPSEAILETAAKEQVDLIAMSTHGRTGISRIVFGSVAEQVVRKSGVPVLLVRSTQEGISETTFRRILVPVDGGERSLEIVRHAEAFVRIFGSEVVVLHVEAGVPAPVGSFYGAMGAYEPGMPFLQDSPEASSIDTLARFMLRLSEAGVFARSVNVAGDPATKILDVAREQGADLIAMSTHGRSGVARLVLGSVTETVLRSTPVPMLVVRP